MLKVSKYFYAQLKATLDEAYSSYQNLRQAFFQRGKYSSCKGKSHRGKFIAHLVRHTGT